MGLIEKEGKVIPWQINDMIDAKFDTIGGKNLGYFCVDCGGNSISKLEVDEEHGGHRVLQVFRCSREYGYRIDHVWEIRSLLDVSGVCPYKINTWYVFFPKSRKKIEENSLDMRNLWGKSPGFCVGCGARMCHDAPADYRFCSILCKLSCPDAQQYYSAANWVNLVMPLLNRVSLATKKINMRSSSSNSGSLVTKEESGGELGSCFRLKIKPGVGIMRADSADQKLGKESQKRSRKRKLLGDMKEEEGQVNMKKRSTKAVSATGYRKSDSLSSAAQVVVISFRKRSRKGVPCRASFY